MHRYTVTLSDPIAHTITVRLEIEQPSSPQVLRLPAWLPGSYMVRDFARLVTEISATLGNGQAIECSKTDKSSWQFDSNGAAVIIEYSVYCWDESVRGAHFDQTHAFFNGSSLFLEVVGQSNLPHLLSLKPPSFNTADQWRVGTSMPSASSDVTTNSAEPYAFGDFFESDYQAFIDHPFEIGELDIVSFEVSGVPHDLIVYGKHYGDLPAISKDLVAICEEQVRFFGGLPKDVKRYVFLVAAFGDAYGGLEHRSSTALHVSRKELPSTDELAENKLSDDYLNFLTLCSHEYFHTWNIKKLRPRQFVDIDLSQEVYTRQLWIFEGFTSYYEDLLVLQSGVIEKSDYLKLLAKVITRVHRGAGRELQSVAESSFEAWTKFYKQDTSAPNVIVSYYTKGKLVALCLDLILRRQSQNKQSLEWVMKSLWQSHGENEIGLVEGEFEQRLTEITGHDWAEFFSSYVYGTDELPLQVLLADAGIELKWEAAGLYNTFEASKKRVIVSLGASFSVDPQGLLLRSVFKNELAYQAGLASGDRLIAIDGLKVDSGSVEKQLNQFQPGDKVKLHAFRRDELMEIEVTVPEPVKTTATLIDLEGNDKTSTDLPIQWPH